MGPIRNNWIPIQKSVQCTAFAPYDHNFLSLSLSLLPSPAGAVLLVSLRLVSSLHLSLSPAESEIEALKPPKLAGL